MISLALAYLGQRKLATLLNVLLVALSSALLMLLLLVSSQATSRFSRIAGGVDLVVGAKGSPLQLILSSVFHVDQPTGNIPLSALAMLRKDPAVARATPLALGDSFRGYRIVGTDFGFFDLQRATIADGRLFAAKGEAVLGADVARATGARLGQQFASSHGLGADGGAHEGRPLTAVGVLAPTGGVADRLILTSVETVWDVHGIAHEDAVGAEDHGDSSGHGHDEHDQDRAVDQGAASMTAPAPALQARGQPQPEVTAILVTYRNAAAALRLPAMINRQTALQAAVPAVETGRLLALFGASVAAAQLLGWTLAAIAGLAIFVALFGAAQARAGDLALLRVMGATPALVAMTMILEAVTVAVSGVLVGALAAFGLLWLGVQRFRALSEFGFEPLQANAGVVAIAAASIAIAVIAALIPALRVYRADIVRTLASSV